MAVHDAEPRPLPPLFFFKLNFRCSFSTPQFQVDFANMVFRAFAYSRRRRYFVAWNPCFVFSLFRTLVPSGEDPFFTPPFAGYEVLDFTGVKPNVFASRPFATSVGFSCSHQWWSCIFLGSKWASWLWIKGSPYQRASTWRPRTQNAICSLASEAGWCSILTTNFFTPPPTFTGRTCHNHQTLSRQSCAKGTERMLHLCRSYSIDGMLLSRSMLFVETAKRHPFHFRLTTKEWCDVINIRGQSPLFLRAKTLIISRCGFWILVTQDFPDASEKLLLLPLGALKEVHVLWVFRGLISAVSKPICGNENHKMIK